MKLKDITCKAAKPTEKQYKLADGNGLYLLVKPNGGRYWRYKYRYMGKEKIYSIGVYPEIALLEARELHRQAHKQVVQGIDPNEHKQHLNLKKQTEYNNTFAAIAEDWLNKMADEVKPNTLKGIQSRLERYIFPDIGNIPIKQITSPMIVETLRKIEARDIISTANRT